LEYDKQIEVCLNGWEFLGGCIDFIHFGTISDSGTFMKIGDIVECGEFGMALILGPCDVPDGVPEEALGIFLMEPDAWPTVKGWAVQLLEEDGKVLSVHEHNLYTIKL